MAKEIERKFLIDGFPEGLPQTDGGEVWQGYLTFSPEVRIRRVRRDTGDTCTLTVKDGGGLVREEVEMGLDAAQFASLRELVPAGAWLVKTYRAYRLPGGETLECSLVDPGEPTSFYYAEVEFPTERAARAFRPPGVLGPEMTEDPGFSMRRYCEKKAGASGENAGG